MQSDLQVDWCPIIRHLFHWLNGVPASKETVHKILEAGGSVVVIPGGESEQPSHLDNRNDSVIYNQHDDSGNLVMHHKVANV